MKSRALFLGVALLLASSATLAVFLYVNGVKEEAGVGGGGSVSVIVSDRDIPAGTNLDELMAEGAFTAMRVPEDAQVRGAIGDLSALKGRVTSAPVLKGEQITSARLQGGDQALPGGTLGIPRGFEAVTLPLETPRLVGGAIQPGDHITIYGTFNRPEDITVTLVPDVEVLRVTGFLRSDDADATNSVTETSVTLALKAQDSVRVVLAQEKGSIWFALQPPEQEGSKSKPIVQPGVPLRGFPLGAAQ
jgi:pilus assembly protein CpaB